MKEIFYSSFFQWGCIEEAYRVTGVGGIHTHWIKLTPKITKTFSDSMIEKDERGDYVIIWHMDFGEYIKAYLDA